MVDVKIGVIGVGNMGYAHAECIYNGGINGLRLTAVCDINKALKPKLEKTFPDIPFFEDYEELLASADVDAVIIATPHPLHSVIGIRAFESGKHVLVEKPIDISLKNAIELSFAAKKSGKKFAIMFNQRTSNLFRKAKHIVESGQLGILKRSVWIITNWYRTQHYYNSSSWRANWAGEGGGVLVNQAPHQLDLWQWICGMPVSVTAFCDVAKYHNIEVEDDATINVRFENGATGVFITSTGEYPGTNRLEISGSKGKIVIENGVLKWWKLEEDERSYCFNAEQLCGEIEHTYEETVEDTSLLPHKIVLQNFTDAIISGSELIADGSEGLNSLTIQNAAYLSSWQNNKTIKLPFDLNEFESGLNYRKEDSKYSYASDNTVRKSGYRKRWQINW